MEILRIVWPLPLSPPPSRPGCRVIVVIAWVEVSPNNRAFSHKRSVQYLISYTLVGMDDKRSVKRFILMTYTLICLYGQSAGLKTQNNRFLSKHRSDIERYIMTGYGQGWKNCDLIQTDPQQSSSSDETPLFFMDIKKLHTSDILTTFSSSTCLLISAQVRNNQSLSNLIHFGWSVIQRKRLALVLKLTQGMTLNMAPNTTKLPFLIAAEVGEKEQFLCPVVGESSPHLQDTKCNLFFTSCQDKTLRVGIFGGKLDFHRKHSINFY